MNTALLLCFVVETGGIAAAEDLPLRMDYDGPKRQHQAGTEPAWSLGLIMRWHVTDREASDPGDLTRWSNSFSSGGGFRAELDHTVPIGSSWSLGGYASAAYASFEGKTVEDPASGIETRISDWRVIPFTAGPKARLVFAKDFFTEAYGGLGAVLYRAVDAHRLGATVPFVERSTALAWEIGARIGVLCESGDGFLAFVLGVGYESWGNPRTHENHFQAFSARSIDHVTVEFGFWAGF